MIKTISLILSIGICLSLLSCQKKSTNDDNSTDEQRLQQGLLAYYPFNGNANDKTNNGYDLSVNGAVMMDNRFGEMQKAYKFNGRSDFMVIPPILKGDSLRELTISLWANPENLGHPSILSFLPKNLEYCSSYLGFDLSNTSNRTYHRMVFDVTPNVCQASLIHDTIGNPLNKWGHIVFVQRYLIGPAPRYEYNQFYNGKKLKSSSSGLVTPPIATSFSKGGIIGGDNTNGNFDFNFNFFKGGIDDIRIYNRALSDAEVAQLYNLRD